MKRLSAIALAVTFALSGSAFAGDAPTTKEDCEKAHMTWDEAHSKCVKQ